MHLSVHGAGTALFLLHPFPFDGRVYDEIAPAIGAFARCSVVDLAGSGRSRTPAPRTLDEHATLIVNKLDEQKIDRVILGGLSFGGYLALVFARRFPERLAGLLLMSTRAASDTPEIRRQRNDAIALVETRGVHALVAKQLPTWLSPKAPAAARDVATSIAMSQRPATVLAGLAAMLDREDATPLLAKIAVPTHIVSGSVDTLTRPEEMRRLLAIPGAVFHAVEGASHLIAQTHPEALIEAARALVRDVEALQCNAGVSLPQHRRGSVLGVAREEVKEA